MASKVAIVTGGNKGIGLAIVKGLCEKFNGVVYLTARDVKRGEEAVSELKKSGLNPVFYQLDVNNVESIRKFHDFIKEKHGGIDVLVNNAAIAFANDATEPFAHQAEVTLKTNYFALVDTCKILFPLLRDNARVVNLSSSAGHLAKIPSDELKKKLGGDSLTIEELNELMNNFIKSAKEGTNKDLGWGTSTYVVSKVGATALTRIQQREANKGNKNLYINCVHPGYVNTDMTRGKGPLTVEEGAVAPLFLAVGDHKLKGAYVWRDCTVVDWLGKELPAMY